ncbi:MAG: prefoldin subunit alpha [Candidatus Altiarchaeota archaeon]|nr:prefoldin subunit alpha [Candidatus Altiarchaeota archaeon]
MEVNLQTKMIQLEYLNQQIQTMQVHLNEILRASDELSILKVGLTNIEEAKNGDEMLVPLGASSYIPAKIKDVKNVIVSVGAGVFIEKPIGDAMPIVEKQMDELRKQEDTIMGNLNLLSKESEKLTGELNQAMRSG